MLLFHSKSLCCGPLRLCCGPLSLCCSPFSLCCYSTQSMLWSIQSMLLFHSVYVVVHSVYVVIPQRVYVVVHSVYVVIPFSLCCYSTQSILWSTQSMLLFHSVYVVIPLSLCCYSIQSMLWSTQSMLSFHSVYVVIPFSLCCGPFSLCCGPLSLCYGPFSLCCGPVSLCCYSTQTVRVVAHSTTLYSSTTTHRCSSTLTPVHALVPPKYPRCCGFCCSPLNAVYVVTVLMTSSGPYTAIHSTHNIPNTTRSFVLLSFNSPSSGAEHTYVNVQLHSVTEAASSTSHFVFMCLYLLPDDGRMNHRNRCKIIMKVSIVFAGCVCVHWTDIDWPAKRDNTPLHETESFLRS